MSIINPHTGQPMSTPNEETIPDVYVLAPETAMTNAEITDLLLVMGLVLPEPAYERLDPTTKTHFILITNEPPNTKSE